MILVGGGMIKNFQIQMRPQAFDLWTSFFMAVIVLLATLVWVLFILWLFADQPVVAEVHTPARVTIVGKSGSEQPEFEVPRASEVAQLQQPDVLEQLETADLSTVIARVAAQNSNQAGFVSASDGGGIPGKDVGPDPGADVVPRFERWELNFEAKDAKSYAIQLDQMGIQLGAFGGGDQRVALCVRLIWSPGRDAQHAAVGGNAFVLFVDQGDAAGWLRTDVASESWNSR